MAEEKKDFPELDYESFGAKTAEVAEVAKDNTISFRIYSYKGDQGNTRGNTAKLYWDENRQMWLAKVEGEFLESEFDKDTGGILYLPYTDGPFALNLSAHRKILEAYSIPENRVNINNVSRLSPSELEKLAQSPQQPAPQNEPNRMDTIDTYLRQPTERDIQDQQDADDRAHMHGH